ncbi:hypothetical protein GR160_11595 [Flavobacterium sp. Sd200]|uniref:C40 family peptidase n=1 Tax=Flavobacterium sp. Sd200 TaxID=2692211 RepID=UPI0013702E06|nr:C40 family peptidase [Flavobacterium sp. Sd200]MXN91866.1 hypothetical protein [Flavobacterium sp. Sd200]
MKNLLNLSLFLMLATSFSATAQIVTFKKEAQKKGLYAYNGKQANSQAETLAKAQALQKASATQAKEEVVFLDNDVVVVDNSQPVVKPKAKAKGGPKKTEAPKTKKKALVVVDEPTSPDFEPTPYENYFAQQIVNNAMQFEGVPYRGGGTTTAGMDCSGMVYATFQIFDVTLPRSSASMASEYGREVKLDEVKKGDLLFFDNNPARRRINHVGIVTEVTPEGEIKFIHSSTSRGVMVSSMNEAYHSRTFVQANRVIEDDIKS